MRFPAAAPRRPAVAGSRLRAALTPSRRLRRLLLVAAALVVVLAGLYTLWLRDSSLVAVEDVAVTGLTSRDADRIRVALTGTAETMTTLHFDERRLEQAAAAFPVVAAVEAEPDFPHSMTIRVIERRPAAIVDADGRRLPVAGDGTLVAGVSVEGSLPTIDLAIAMPERRLPPGAASNSARVAGAAPAAIARRLDSLAWEGGARGVVARIESGPEIVFGAPARLRAKWAAAIRVLADEEAAGAAYVDVRIPERPVAGGLSAEVEAPAAAVAEAPVAPAPIAPEAPPPTVPANPQP